MDILYVDIFKSLGCYYGSHLLASLLSSRRGRDEIKVVDGSYRYFSQLQVSFIRVNENMAQHPSNNISIGLLSLENIPLTFNKKRLLSLQKKYIFLPQ